MCKKLAIIVLCFMLFSLTQERVGASTRVSDVPSTHWAYGAVSAVVSAGYMSVDDDQMFHPDEVLTRAETVAAIAKSISIEAPPQYKPGFKDMAIDHPYYDEIRALAYAGVIQNTSYFYPDQPLTRAQIAKMMLLAYQVELDTSNKARFTDYTAKYWAKHYIESLADAKLIKGVTATKFAPTGYVTRAQLASFIQRGLQFQQSIANYECIYDYLSKDYLITTNHYKQWTKEVVQLVNKERISRNLPALQEDLALTQLAIIKASDMVKRHYFEHQSPFYGNPWDMAAIFDYEFTSFGENIARNYQSPQAVVTAWMNSEKHRENILRSNYTFIGIGVKKDAQGQLIWVQQFSSK